MADDERRRSSDELAEMDGTGLYEREGWPLEESRRIREGAESEKEEEEGAQHELDDGIDRRHDDIRETVVETGRRRARSEVSLWGENDERVIGEPPPMPDNVPHRLIASSPTEPSPVRKVQGHERQLLPEISREISQESAELLSPTLQEDDDVSPVHDEFAHSEVETNTDSTEGADSYRNSDYRAAQHDSNGYPMAQSPDMEGYPSTFGAHSFASSTSQPGFTDSPALANSQPWRNSIAKTTPPQKQPSSRRSPSITTQMPFNAERVRYSWQSIKDDEPNRPRIHIIKLVSNTATASAGFPQGEAFGFSISPAGRRIAAYNSARLYILQTGALPVGISQDYALKRRPLGVEIIDEGNLIAILADQHTVNLYDLTRQGMGIIRTIKLDFPTNCIALAPTGGLVAAAYEGGIEIFSLDPNALPTDRRAVRSVKMDRMSFSEDGSTLLGTTTRINVSSTVTVTVPVFPSAASGIPTHEELREAWCSDLLHPENIRNSSHATFMRENRSSSNERLFAWNGMADTFGILNTGDMQYGNIDFPVAISPPLSTCGGLGAAMNSTPAIDEHGDTVAMIVNDRTIRLYIVPQTTDDEETSVEAHSIDHELDEGHGCPFSEARWVYSSASLPAPSSSHTQVQGRLIVTSPGGVVDPAIGEEMIDDIEGGRIIMFDFDPQFAGQPGQTFSLTLGRNPPQLLEEPKMDVAQEVALVRRRTVNQSKGVGLSSRPAMLGRAASTFTGRRDRERHQNPNGRGLVGISAAHRRSMLSISSLNSEATRSLPDLMEGSETMDTFEEPYAQNAPRSQASLQRAATNAQRHRFQTIEERTQERQSVDSSNGFLPLPEYTAEPNAPLPGRFRQMAGLDAPTKGPEKAAIVTNTDGDHRSPASDGPSTAPAHLGENFSPEQAFAAALQEQTVRSDERSRQPEEETLRPESQTLAQSRDERSRSTSPDRPSTTVNSVSRSPSEQPVQRSDTMDSMNRMPRSLRRAYSNAPLGTGPPPALIGDWANVSPVSRTNTGESVRPQPSHRLRTRDATVREDETWVPVSPVDPGAAGPSTSPPPPRPTSSRKLPAHMQFLHRAAANNAAASASLFPPTQRNNHVPLRSSPTGNVPHPVTGWHPPAASSSPTLASPPHSATNGLSHSRRSSDSLRSAGASTTKARSFLGRGKSRARRKKKPFDPGIGGGRDGRLGPGGGDGRGGQSVMETKSLMTTWTGREGKCAVM